MNARKKLNYVIAASKSDPAGVTLSQCLISKGQFKPNQGSAGSDGIYESDLFENVTFYSSKQSVLDMGRLDELFPSAYAYVFLSKHKSDSAIPTLTCHTVGNFSDNPYGGNRRELGIAFPSLQKKYMQAITNGKIKVPGYDIVIEATHHGPTSLSKPAIFVELGSSSAQWVDKNAADYIASSLLAVIDDGNESCARVAIGLGGTHYPSKFNKLLIDSDIGLAAVASKHNLEAIDKEMLLQMISRSSEKVTLAAIDSKGLGSQKERIFELVRESQLVQLVL